MPRKSKRSLAASRRWKRAKQDELATKVKVPSPNSSAADQCSQRKVNDNSLISDSLLNHFGTFNWQELHTCAAPPTSATDNAASRKRKLDDTEGKSYIKKPLNAFMLFKAEQRHNVAEELHITDSAKVNVVLGQRWKMMSEQEQAPYFDRAHRERRVHEAMYHGWSPNDIHRKKAKRREADKILVPPNRRHFAFPVATANQQPAMTGPYAPANHEPAMTGPYAPANHEPALTGPYAPAHHEPAMTWPYAPAHHEPAMTGPYASAHHEPAMTGPYAPANHEPAMTWPYAPANHEPAMTWPYAPANHEPAMAWSYAPANRVFAMTWPYAPANHESVMTWSYAPANHESVMTWSYAPANQQPVMMWPYAPANQQRGMTWPYAPANQQRGMTWPYAPANQQPVMTGPYATAPMSFPNQALNNQAHSYHAYQSHNNQRPFQELPVETNIIVINGIPVQATP